MSNITDNTFKRIAEIAHRRWGLSLGERKMQLVANRLSSYLRKNGGGEIEDYVQRLDRNPTEEDMLVLFDLLSTNVTSFFRDPAHFAFLEREGAQVIVEPIGTWIMYLLSHAKAQLSRRRGMTIVRDQGPWRRFRSYLYLIKIIWQCLVPFNASFKNK